MSEGPQRVTIWLLIILVLVVFAAAVTYFSRNNPELQTGNIPSLTPTRTSQVYKVFYQLGIFSPTNLRIHAGDSVKFENDSKELVHVISDSNNNIPNLPGFDSIGDIQPNGAFTYTFTEAGIFGYHNARNADETGTIIVKP